MQFGKTNAAEDSEFLEDIEGAFQTVNAYGQEVAYRAKSWKQYRPTPTSVAPPAVKNTSSLTADLPYRGGERVSHPKFGAGQVLAVAGTGDKQEVTVHFEKAGMKKLLVRFANLTRL